MNCFAVRFRYDAKVFADFGDISPMTNSTIFLDLHPNRIG